jgi:hypothetical protein
LQLGYQAEVRSQIEPVQDDAHAALDVGNLTRMGIETDLSCLLPSNKRKSNRALVAFDGT